MGVVSETPYGACIRDKYFFFSYEAVTETDGNLMWIKLPEDFSAKTAVHGLAT